MLENTECDTEYIPHDKNEYAIEKRYAGAPSVMPKGKPVSPIKHCETANR